VLRNFVRAKPRGKILSTDAMSGAGAGPGRYQIGRLTIEVGTDGVARQPGGRGFAGSTLAPDQGVRNCVSYLGLDPSEAATLWSEAAARAFNVTLPPFQS
jgi:N-acetylglucosamine-6-phosphate deacetylase